jgi:hypothetical protein
LLVINCMLSPISMRQSPSEHHTRLYFSAVLLVVDRADLGSCGRRALEQGAIAAEHRAPDQLDWKRALLEKRVVKFAEVECSALLFANVLEQF